ncbi:putative DNA-binding domain-containing protein [Undibacterium sp. SXout7W]|uniref:HvfC/BufC family peptide modification chaperone n=1 Tax=Undibacterium sp. SXout7W TaxID=3413049 RepID=UPI003BEFC5DA
MNLPPKRVDSLDQLQQHFQEFILGQQDADSVLPFIAETKKTTKTADISGQTRLDIYYQAYRLRLRDALSEAFDKTHRYLGDDLFFAACTAYIAAHSSRHRNLRWYGSDFPDFLRSYCADIPLVAELATFEWTLSLAFDAADQPVLTLADLGNLQAEDWETAGFVCQQSNHFLRMDWNCVAIWLALTADEYPPEPLQNTAPVIWHIWRKQQQPQFRSLNPDEAQALQAIVAGYSFAATCVAVSEQFPESAAHLGAWLQTWITQEMLSQIQHISDQSGGNIIG